MFSDYCLHLYCYIHNVSADMSSGIFPVFLVEFESLHGTSNRVRYLIHRGRLIWFRNHKWIQVLSVPILLIACTQDWTCNLLMIVTPLTVTPCIQLQYWTLKKTGEHIVRNFENIMIKMKTTIRRPWIMKSSIFVPKFQTTLFDILLFFKRTGN